MKKFISGVLVGVLLAGISVGAVTQYVAKPVSYPVLVNGQKFTTDKPIVSINGSTYMPLKAVGDALGIKVKWNQDKSQVEIGEAAASKKSDDGLITIGFSQVGVESGWREASTDSMKEALSKKNGFELIYSDAQFKQENQIKAVRDFISKGADVIAIAPITEVGWETVLEEAKAAGIPVIIIDRMIKVTDDSLYTCWVGNDFKKEGIDAGNWLIDYAKKTGKDKKTQNVVVLKGVIGSSAEIGRTQGVDEALKAAPFLKVIAQETGEFTQDKGQEAMESILKKYKNIDAVIAQNDNMAFGAIDALKAAGKNPGKDVTIVSFDGCKEAFQKMIDGEINVDVEINPLHGPKVADLAKKLINKEEVQKVQYMEDKVYPAEVAAEEIGNRF